MQSDIVIVQMLAVLFYFIILFCYIYYLYAAHPLLERLWVAYAEKGILLS